MTDQKVRRYKDPIFLYLFEYSIPTIKHYHSDLGHDAIILSGAEIGDKFLWACHETGTHMVQLPKTSDEIGSDYLRAVIGVIGTGYIHTFHLLEVTKKVNLFPSGYVTHLGAKTAEDVLREWNTVVEELRQAAV